MNDNTISLVQKCIYGGHVQKLCDNFYCYYCFDKSFASHEKSIFYNIENEFPSRKVFVNSSKKMLF